MAAVNATELLEIAACCVQMRDKEKLVVLRGEEFLWVPGRGHVHRSLWVETLTVLPNFALVISGARIGFNCAGGLVFVACLFWRPPRRLGGGVSVRKLLSQNGK